MKTELINEGFVKIDGDKLRVEAPYKERDETRLEDFTLKDGRKAQRCVVTKAGRKLRTRIGRPNELEPKIWHFYKRDGERFRIVKDSFEGTRAEAVAACIKQFGKES